MEEEGSPIFVENHLNKELSILNSKLVASIEKQASLEDNIHWTYHELMLAKERIRELEASQKDYMNRMEQALLEKQEVEKEIQQLMARLMEEKQQRGKAEIYKHTVEKELEDLTKTLFEEANRMVSSAHRDRDRLEKYNEHLQAKLKDTEGLLHYHEKQLAELKDAMQHMSNEEGASVPSTPKKSENRISIGKNNELIREIEEEEKQESSICSTGLFIRRDIPVFQEFMNFLQGLRSWKNQTSDTQGVNMTLTSGTLLNSVSSLDFPMYHGLNGSSNTLQTLTTSSSSSSSFFQLNNLGSSNSFKDSKFIKRCIYEDIEPTLRLDNSPTLSWLARRTVLSSILDGHLVIEPVSSKSFDLPSLCSLCGNNCYDEKDARIHQFRTSESQNHLKSYPLCSYCLRRLRSVCNFTGFLRQLRDGLWKIDDEDIEIKAWEEVIRHREAMFWLRIGVSDQMESIQNKTDFL
ncbi:hypothetical protein T552_00825 [Pneumocystis carinii B80]|uniref:GDP/GTP exchange factor Sec2 N-terminal domain-containing protein n=1 Tax=Pneumocystis carinii (strain B80) TaxID=1408658 RepID=A0A0W4ZPT6_PNEC8|nr:hypothetical protein T552_00825 [Pneumocystis carinii B80]KTW30352.1 hypothetical protein T552_00825 [Pneumocystis carinii B80]